MKLRLVVNDGVVHSARFYDEDTKEEMTFPITSVNVHLAADTLAEVTITFQPMKLETMFEVPTPTPKIPGDFVR